MPERSQLYWYADYVYLYRTTLICPDCGYSEKHTASEAYVHLSRRHEKKSIPLRDYKGVVGDKMPYLNTQLRETKGELVCCPNCFENMELGDTAYPALFAPASALPPEEIEAKHKAKKKKPSAPPSLDQLLKRVS